MSVRLYDSQTQSVRELKPVIPGQVSIYLCGATVQGSPHIGHLRSALAFDVLIRWLYRRGYDVTYVRNVTDIDDKILNKSVEQGRPWWAHALKFEREFTQAYRALGTLEPTYEPRATGHITDQIELIELLMERGHAYADGKGNVYFAVRSLPDYGSLTHQNIDDLATTEDEGQISCEIEAGKRDACDFALWKAPKVGEPETAAWNSPWGRGRPGWHLECSAMSRRYLGESFDIHGGGIDLRFPHHENEQAQSHGAGWGFAQMWVHNAWVTIKGEKMSKSLGNSLVVAEILKSTPAPVLRMALGTVHHRSTVEYSPESIELAAGAWERLNGFVSRAAQFLGESDESAIAGTCPEVELEQLPANFVRAMDDDLNLALAMATIWEHVKAGNSALTAKDEAGVRSALRLVRSMSDVLGLDPLSAQWAGNGEAAGGSSKIETALGELVGAVLDERTAARAQKDWARADELRDRLIKAGIVVEDGADGARWHL